MSKALFVTGTGTDVGKTYVAALMAKALKDAGLNAAYYKAAVSGNVRRPDGSLIPGDARFVREFAHLDQGEETMCPYVYEHAWSPHLAAQAEGNPPELPVIQKGFQAVCQQHEIVTVEGSGGILCPLRYDEHEKLWLEDVVRQLGLASVIVAHAGLGTINSVVLTAEYMRARGLAVKGVIFNHFHPGDRMEEDNVAMCKARTGLPVLALVQDDMDRFPMDGQALAALYDEVK